MKNGTDNEREIRSLFDRLDGLGVREYVVCAGARNAALIAVVTARAERDERFVVRHFFDERSAGFFALGRVMVTRKPVAVLTTSGTAVAELLPAMMEAHYQALPLVAVTADRPAHYAGSGAPQAVEQEGIFGVYANGTMGGPLHFNVRLEEEALDGGALERCVIAGEVTFDGGPELTDTGIWEDFWSSDAPLVVLVAGLHPDDVKMVSAFLAKLGATVVAEATANLDRVPELQELIIRGDEKLLRSLEVGRVLRIGAVPSWRWWRDLEDREDVMVLSISKTSFRGLARKERVVCSPWSALTRDVGAVEARLAVENDDGGLERLIEQFPNSEVAWMRHLSNVVGADARLFLGNSLPIREWNLAAARRSEAGLEVFANRGANGIDGLVSTWLGVGDGADESWLVVGDLSALYDMNALWILPQLREGKRRLVVINNSGGQIFSQVRWLSDLAPPARKVMTNAHGLGFESWASMWGVGYRCFSDWRDLSDDGDGSGTVIWEIRPDADESAAFWRAWS